MVVFCVGTASGEQPPPVRIMPLGDSITLGDVDSSNTVEGGYRTRLYSLLTAAGYNVDYVGTLTDSDNPALSDRDHEGHGGYPIEGIREDISFWLGRVQEPDVILLHIGTNDFWTGKSLAVTQASLRNLLADLSSLRPYAKIIVASLIPRTDKSSYENTQMQFNASLPEIVSEQVALGRRVSLVDMHGAFAPADLPTDLSADGVHPSLVGYGKMADCWLPAITQVISPLGTVDPPVIAKVDARADLGQVTVTFSKPIKDDDVIPANFSLTGGLSITQAILDTASKRIVTLMTSTQSRGAIYSLSVSGVHDLRGYCIPLGSAMHFISQSVIDGSFEEYSPAWAGSGNVAVSDSPMYSPAGGKLMVFNDNQAPANGVISQSIPTQPSQKYRLSFDMGVYAFSAGTQGLKLTVTGGNVLLSQTETMIGKAGGSTKWQALSYEFVADSGSATLKFEDVSEVTFNIDLLLDNVRLDAVFPQTLTVNSSSTSGVGMMVSPPDLGGLGDGVTSFTRAFSNSTLVTITAPANNAEGFIFQKWQRNGVDYSMNRTISVIMGADYTLTSMYVPNTPPIAIADSFSGTVGTPLIVDAPGTLGNDMDAESGMLTAVLDTAPTFGSVILSPNGSFTYQPAAHFAGQDFFTYQANDGALTSNEATVLLTVNATDPFVNGSFEAGTPLDYGTLDGWFVTGNAVSYSTILIVIFTSFTGRSDDPFSTAAILSITVNPSVIWP